MLALLFSLILIPQAEARLSTTQFSCRDAKALVDQYGAIVLSTGPHTYDRFVSHRGHCPGGEDTVSAYVPTLDERRCFIGYICRDRGP